MLVAYILSKIRSFRLHRENIRELMQFTDRELEDLGISRYEVDVIAR